MAVVGHTDMTKRNRLWEEDLRQLKAVHTHLLLIRHYSAGLVWLDCIHTAGSVCWRTLWHIYLCLPFLSYWPTDASSSHVKPVASCSLCVSLFHGEEQQKLTDAFPLLKLWCWGLCWAVTAVYQVISQEAFFLHWRLTHKIRKLSTVQTEVDARRVSDRRETSCSVQVYGFYGCCCMSCVLAQSHVTRLQSVPWMWLKQH